ncbi:MAG: growth inhibitor protein [Parcubacteria group bacterium Gr01-1014_18]|nr:MAG: growth inhibitor protein [Parcubacteria group bacterium Greene0416_36]TSC80727.1 MAG: growth inhibitor protein [Parcubacteria group bacterium Gr01-1014_18]TSC98662.1 MAG: growth inhibitor protein [Parcubacteria group bacterium Greene1014_20]TSD07178.1 MAG: growth inhibitor protein [Parcubacteria group bacterium Greene0714_2]
MKNKTLFPKRGEIYLVNFDPTVGAEMKKTRPALILQNDIANKYSAITIIAAITSQFELPLYPTEVLLDSSACRLDKESVIVLNQIRSIDKTRLIKKIGEIPAKSLQQIEIALKISLGLIKIE